MTGSLQIAQKKYIVSSKISYYQKEEEKNHSDTKNKEKIKGKRNGTEHKVLFRFNNCLL